ncbi:hypothetical protein [uncultured Lacinutrix sp.]|uniref:hypothetical protein n=1 Tax=uncultured Lacinutrix sp. TaxID=574032 RepID=UPI00261BA0F6|nr:hypothetical protein [uncultured Lacinutrix sp.]
MKKTVLILLALIAFTSVSAQQSLNDYKYIIIPNKFDFLKEADQYRLNSLTKFLFEKYNFEALIEDEVLPSDYAKNNCLGLKANLLKESTMFKTKLVVQLTNCKNQVVFTSTEGESRDKNFKIAYNQALRNAFKSIESANYSYNPENMLLLKSNTPDIAKEQEEIKMLKEEIENLKNEKEVVVKESKVEDVVVAKAKEIVAVSPSPETFKRVDVLYAQKIENGFQLVDSTPKVVYNIKETGMSNVYLVEGENAILYKLDANWILEYYKNEILQTKIVNIKF